MDELLLKYKRLDSLSKKQLLNFLDFLLGKQAKKQPDFNMESYRKKLLKVSIWSKDDISAMKQNASHFNNWKGNQVNGSRLIEFLPVN